MQISAVTGIGVALALLVSRNVTFTIFSAALVALCITYFLAYKRKLSAAIYLLISTLSLMLFALALTGAGIFDLAALGFPGLLVFAATLGGGRLFSITLALTMVQALLLSGLAIEGFITPHVPSLRWVHVMFIIIIFSVTGFSVYVLVKDIKKLMLSLQIENQKVEESHAHIQHLAHHDPLTNLPNRLYGEQLFASMFMKRNPDDKNIAVFFLDLDNFKPVNDALGHSAGDTLLKMVSEKLQTSLPHGEHLIRFGGDEFIVLAPCARDEESVKTLAKTIMQACEAEFDILESKVSITTSLGVAIAPLHGTDFKQLCRKADVAMYHSKQHGRNTFHIYEASLDNDGEERFSLLQMLRTATQTSQFEMYYQPIVNLNDGSTPALEALIRWPQDDGSFIPPDGFIPIAESSGLIVEIGQWVIDEVCRFGAQMQKKGYKNLRIAINISAVQFRDNSLVTVVNNALKHHGVPASMLELELTESLFINDKDGIAQQINQLRELGIAIAIDDFGTGYSNLNYLRSFNATTLKIDRSFIGALGKDKYDKPLIAAIVNMAKSLGLKTVAEGIEDEAALATLMELGCEFGQGYYWSKPVPSHSAHQLLKIS
ncbi:putative bifunctional diguanylate cyclase/phosphodiesterase [Alteromonas sp. A079]|uniref:putative bifunctional diguanylate cyclase/phosphodiesterase n=1 Tax=Alteromonas sp. A079 TaxID=3410268 RepID=UPI003BA22984